MLKERLSHLILVPSFYKLQHNGKLWIDLYEITHTDYDRLPLIPRFYFAIYQRYQLLFFFHTRSWQKVAFLN